MNNSSNRGRTLVDFSDAAFEPTWHAINDEVMGGDSEGSPVISDGILHFTGTLSLENSGGFASVRGRGQGYDLSDSERLVLRVKGDGRSYQLRLYTDVRHQGSRIAYAAGFSTAPGEWVEPELSLSQFRPVFRGRDLPGPPLDPAGIRELGFLLADRKPGAFHLQVAWIKTR